MSDQFNENEHLLRAIWPSYLKSNGTIDSAAFKPRLPRGETGVSVDRTDNRTLEDSVNETRKHFDPKSGIVSITVSQCHSAEAHVEFTPRLPVNPYHSEIFANSDLQPLDAIQSKRLANLAVVQIPPTSE